MNQDNDIRYYMRREWQSREMAAKATDLAIACIHTEIAEIYAEKIRALTPRPRLRLIQGGAPGST